MVTPLVINKVLDHLNAEAAIGLVFLGYQLALVYWPSDSREDVELEPPFKGDWSVFDGGDCLWKVVRLRLDSFLLKYGSLIMYL
jgi:hypothetical protein